MRKFCYPEINMMFLSAAKSATLTIKMIRWLFIWGSLRIATRLHGLVYVEAVYGKREDPPSFDGMLTNLFVMLLLFHVLILAIVHSMVVTGMFTQTVTRYAITESVAYVAFIMAIAWYMGTVVTDKVYFSYRKDGLRAIRAYKELVLWAVFPICISPIFFTT